MGKRMNWNRARRNPWGYEPAGKLERQADKFLADHPEAHDTPHGQIMKLSQSGRLAIEASPIRPGVSAHDLLHQVVMAVITHGHASDLYEFADVMEYFGSQVPDDPDAFGQATLDFFNPEAVTEEWRRQHNKGEIK